MCLLRRTKYVLFFEEEGGEGVDTTLESAEFSALGTACTACPGAMTSRTPLMWFLRSEVKSGSGLN